MRQQGLVQAIVILKPISTSKSDLEIMSKQLAQIVTKCCRTNIKVIDVIIIFGNGKDISKRVKALKEHEEFSMLVTYNSKSIAEKQQDYVQFVNDMRDWYGIEVISYR